MIRVDGWKFAARFVPGSNARREDHLEVSYRRTIDGADLYSFSLADFVVPSGPSIFH